MPFHKFVHRIKDGIRKTDIGQIFKIQVNLWPYSYIFFPECFRSWNDEPTRNDGLRWTGRRRRFGFARRTRGNEPGWPGDANAEVAQKKYVLQ